MWVVVLHGLRDVYDVHTAATVPVSQTPGMATPARCPDGQVCGGDGMLLLSYIFCLKKFYFQMKKRKKGKTSIFRAKDIISQMNKVGKEKRPLQLTKDGNA